MNDSLLRQFAPKLNAGHAQSEVDSDLTDDLGSFGWLRGIRDRAIMLELRRKDGSVTALGYAWLERAEFDPSEGITLRFTGQTVKIIGSNLNAEARPHVHLYDGIVRHRVPWLQEADEPSMLAAPKGSTVIEQLKFV